MEYLNKNGKQPLYAVHGAQRMGSVVYAADGSGLRCTLQNTCIPADARFFTQSAAPYNRCALARHCQSTLFAPPGPWALLLAVWQNRVQAYCTLQQGVDIPATVRRFEKWLSPAPTEAPPCPQRERCTLQALPQTELTQSPLRENRSVPPVVPAQKKPQPAGSICFPTLLQQGPAYPAGPPALQLPGMRRVVGPDGTAYWLCSKAEI